MLRRRFGWHFTQECPAKLKEQRTRVRCSLAGTLPQVLRQSQNLQLLVERQKSLANGVCANCCPRGRPAHHGLVKRAEPPDPSLVHSNRTRRRVVKTSPRTAGAGGVKCIAALG